MNFEFCVPVMIGFRKLLKEYFEKSHPRRNLTAEEARRLARLETIAEKLRRGENVQNRQLQTWLSEEEYEQLEYDCQEQLELRDELKDKPSDLKRYEEKIQKATFHANKVEGFRRKETSKLLSPALPYPHVIANKHWKFYKKSLMTIPTYIYGSIEL